LRIASSVVTSGLIPPRSLSSPTLIGGHSILAKEKGATTLLIPASARKQLNELTDEMVTKINILFYADIREALLKGLAE
jgi:predicted ATP-dependent Lon-type protease